MKNLAEFINKLNQGEVATYPGSMDENEVKLIISLAVHATNFMGQGGTDGYWQLLNSIYLRLESDHGEKVAARLFGEVII